jgi:Ras-related C3 botulinum toxin substrate 1
MLGESALDSGDDAFSRATKRERARVKALNWKYSVLFVAARASRARPRRPRRATMAHEMFFPMKLVVVGDGAVGKTSMLLCYTTNTFPTDYMATVFDNYAVNVPYRERTVNLSLWDTAGQDEYKQFRPLSYDQADGFIVAFSLVDRESFEHVASRWIKEVRLEEKGRSKSKSKPRAPVILVGTKLDLRVKGGRPGADVVTTEMGEKMARKCGAAAYVECSALTQDNLKKVFDVSVAAAAESMFPADETGRTRESAGGGCCAVS